MNDINPFIPILPFLYAEMHYTLKGFSFVHRDWPEILSDAPHRIEPGNDVPFLLLVKDAHDFPITLLSAKARLRYPDGSTSSHLLIDRPVHINQPWWYRILTVVPQPDIHGTVEAVVTFEVQSAHSKKTREFTIDNYRGMSHAPLRIMLPEDPFPRFPGWVFGDLHVHSSLTSDQTEFGAPIEVIAALAPSMGITFAAITDHAYDLDDVIDDYLEQDPECKKWKLLQESIRGLEKSHPGMVFLHGEEVTCRNAFGFNVHMLVINQKAFISGSGDGAEHWFHNRSEHGVPEILDRLEPGGLAYAAHPEVPFHPLHWLFLRRWKWTMSDYRHPRLTGLQILNGPVDIFFKYAFRRWIKQLLNGQKIFIVAGNDAHGNFNRFRQLALPFLYFRESYVHLFGQARTAVYVPGRVSRQAILDALAGGRCVITTGPAMIIEAKNRTESAVIGGNVCGRKLTIESRVLTSRDFGKLKFFRLWLGDCLSKKEVLLKQTTDFIDEQRYDCRLELDALPDMGYIRGEAATAKDGREYHCWTNPIWIQNNP